MNRFLTRSLLTRASSIASGGAKSGGGIDVIVSSEVFQNPRWSMFVMSSGVTDFRRNFSSSLLEKKKSSLASDVVARESKEKMKHAVDETTVKEGTNTVTRWLSYWAVSRLAKILAYLQEQHVFYIGLLFIVAVCC